MATSRCKLDTFGKLLSTNFPSGGELTRFLGDHLDECGCEWVGVGCFCQLFIVVVSKDVIDLNLPLNFTPLTPQRGRVKLP